MPSGAAGRAVQKRLSEVGEKMRGPKNGETVRSFAESLLVAPQQLHVCRDNMEFVSQAGG
jgi:hypothetical protein